MTGQEVREIRKRLGMSQGDFGSLLGFHHPQIRISELERNVRKVSVIKEMYIRHFNKKGIKK